MFMVIPFYFSFYRCYSQIIKCFISHTNSYHYRSLKNLIKVVRTYCPYRKINHRAVPLLFSCTVLNTELWERIQIIENLPKLGEKYIVLLILDIGVNLRAIS